MYQDEIILCGSSAYTKKYYLNHAFAALPESVQQELKIMCVLFTEDIGGTLSLLFDQEGNLKFQTDADEGDLLYDDIGSVLKVRQLQRTKQGLLESLEMYFKVVFLGQDLPEEELEG